MHFEEAVSGVMQTQKIFVLSNENNDAHLGGPPHPSASSLKHISEILTMELEGKQDLWISSEVALSGGRYEDIYT